MLVADNVLMPGIGQGDDAYIPGVVTYLQNAGSAMMEVIKSLDPALIQELTKKLAYCTQ